MKKRSSHPCTDRGHERHLHKHNATVISRRRGNNRIRKILSSKLLRKHDRRGTEVNLTRKVFSKDVFELLNKNLNFFPVPGEVPILKNPTLVIPLPNRNLFARRNKTWTPKFNHHTVDTFISCVTKELEESKPNLIPKDNLTGKERRALQELSIRDDIVITKADKGGATVIVDVKDYVQEAIRQLQDTQYYRELNYNPTEDHANLICNTIDEFRNNHELDEDIAEGLKPIEPRTPRFTSYLKYMKTVTLEDLLFLLLTVTPVIYLHLSTTTYKTLQSHLSHTSRTLLTS